jgi:glutamate-1-semialdehyde 2,1-aminomutase
VRAQGAYVWNLEGKQFIDHLLAYGPIVIGHCDPRINAAVSQAVSSCDINWVGPQAGEVELAEVICEVMPSAEKVAFCTSGTDATLHAVHLARAASGRTRLLKFFGSYHGWHDHVAVGARFRFGKADAASMHEASAAGLHQGPVQDVTVVEWNDFAGVEAAFADHGQELAGAFVEPYVHSYGCVAPAPGFLELLRELCTRHDALLIFDEIKTGFRHHVGGYQAVCGVTPDLTTFGKAIGNGYSLSGIAGQASIMDLLGSASDVNATLEGTYNASPYAMAAGLATLTILRTGGIDRLFALGDRLRAGLSQAIAESGVEACVVGFGSEWAIYFRKEIPTNYSEAIDTDGDRAETFRRAMLDVGILEPPFVLSDRRLCVAMTETDVDRTVEAVAAVLHEIPEP